MTHMDVMVGFRSFLLGNAAIAALVGARVYTPRLPEKPTLPAIQLTLVSSIDVPHLRGPGGTPRDRIQVDAWARTRDDAVALGRLCRQRLNGFTGTWLTTGSPVESMFVKSLLFEVGSERFEEDILGGLCRHLAEYQVTYSDRDDQVLI